MSIFSSNNKSPVNQVGLKIGFVTINPVTIEQVSVHASIDRIPRAFHVRLALPSTSNTISSPYQWVQQPTTLTIGGATVVTGYTDTVKDVWSEGEHYLDITGRGMCADLIDNVFDSSDLFSTSNTSNTVLFSEFLGKTSTIQTIADICDIYGINVLSEMPQDDPSLLSPNVYFNTILGQNAFSVLDAITKQAGLLIFEDAFGQFVIGKAGSSTPKSNAEPIYDEKELTNDHSGRNRPIGFTKNTASPSLTMPGDGVINCRYDYDSRQVYGDYQFYVEQQLSPALLGQVVGVGSVHQPWINLLSTCKSTKYPFGKKRVRKYAQMATMVLNPNIFPNTTPTTQQQIYANWFANRSLGRAEIIECTVVGWNDPNGKLWTPNTLVEISFKHWKDKEQMLLVSCEYNQSPENGTTTSLIFCAPMAFSVEPVNYPGPAIQRPQQ